MTVQTLGSLSLNLYSEFLEFILTILKFEDKTSLDVN